MAIFADSTAARAVLSALRNRSIRAGLAGSCAATSTSSAVSVD
jgi:hypothetical protein